MARNPEFTSLITFDRGVLYLGSAAGALYQLNLHHTKTPTVIAGKEGEKGLVDGTAADARFGRISGLCCMPHDMTLAIADEENHAIRFIASGLLVKTLSGGNGSGREDGFLQDALYDFPNSIAVLSNDKLIVTERDSSDLRLLSLLNQRVTTIRNESNVLPPLRLFPVDRNACLILESTPQLSIAYLDSNELGSSPNLIQLPMNSMGTDSPFFHLFDDYATYLNVERHIIQRRLLSRNDPSIPLDLASYSPDNPPYLCAYDEATNIILLVTLKSEEKGGGSELTLTYYNPASNSVSPIFAGFNRPSPKKAPSSPSGGFGKPGFSSSSSSDFGPSSSVPFGSVKTLNSFGTNTHWQGFKSHDKEPGQKIARPWAPSASAARKPSSSSRFTPISKSEVKSSGFGAGFGARISANSSAPASTPAPTFGTSLDSSGTPSALPKVPLNFSSGQAGLKTAPAKSAEPGDTTTPAASKLALRQGPKTGSPVFGGIRNPETLIVAPHPISPPTPEDSRYTPTLFQDIGTRNGLMTNITGQPFYEGFSNEQIRWLSQTSPHLFPSSFAGSLDQKESKGEEVPLKPLKVVQEENLSSGSLFEFHQPSYANGFTYKQPSTIVYAPVPLASPMSASLNFSNLSRLLDPTTPMDQFSDLNITNKHWNHEFKLHKALLAAAGIGSHPRLSFASNGPESFSEDTNTPKSSNHELAVQKKLIEEKAEAKMQKFKMLLETSNQPLPVLNLVIRMIYQVYLPDLRSNWDYSRNLALKTISNLPRFSIEESLEWTAAALLLDLLAPSYAARALIHWQETVLNRASASESAEFLSRVFSLYDAPSKPSNEPNSSDEEFNLLSRSTVRFVLVATLERLFGKHRTFDEFRSSSGLSLVIDKLAPTGSMESSSSIINGMLSHHLGRPYFPLEWHSATSNVSISTSFAPPFAQQHEEKGARVLSKLGAGPNEFVICIEGTHRYMVVQGWLLFVQWRYFETLAQANLSEMRSRVIVLPSNFRSKVLDLILQILHGYTRLDAHRSAGALSENELNFLISDGIQFGIFRDWDITCGAADVFESLWNCLRPEFRKLKGENLLHVLYLQGHFGSRHAPLLTKDVFHYMAMTWDKCYNLGQKYLKFLNRETLGDILQALIDTNVPCRGGSRMALQTFHRSSIVPFFSSTPNKFAVRYVRGLPLDRQSDIANLFKAVGITIQASRFWQDTDSTCFAFVDVVPGYRAEVSLTLEDGVELPVKSEP